MFSDLDGFRLSAGLPDGIDPAQDAGATMTGVLLGVDVQNRQVQVRVGGSPVWLPAAPGLYDRGSLVRLSRSVLDGGRLSYCEGPLGDAPEIVAGKVLSINSASGTLTVATLGDSFDLPFSAGTYAVGQLVHVFRSASGMGRPIFVIGPQGNFAGTDPGGTGEGSGNPGELTQREAVILPHWSGTWKASNSRWDSWNTDRFGGISTLWQGNAYGSGPLVGLAVYGEQIMNLAAQSIVSITANIVGAYGAGGVPQIRPSLDGARPGGAPAVAGTVVSGAAVGAGKQTAIAVAAADLEGFRTGAYKGLAMVGAGYDGFRGTSKGDGMALTVQYKVVE